MPAVAVPRDIGAAMGAPGRGAGLARVAIEGCGRGTDNTEGCGRNAGPDRGNGRDAGTATTARGIAMREAVGAPTRELVATGGRLGAGAPRGAGAELIAARGNGTIANCAACARSAGITAACGAGLLADGVDDAQGELGGSAPVQGAPEGGHEPPGDAAKGAGPVPLELAALRAPRSGA
jgi:hypothetical protein